MTPDALPRWVKPQLTKLTDTPQDGSGWLQEIKYDGYRLHARLDHGDVRLLTRTGLDWTHKYPATASAVAALRAKQAYVDGERAVFARMELPRSARSRRRRMRATLARSSSSLRSIVHRRRDYQLSADH